MPPGESIARRMSCSCIHTSSGRLRSSRSLVQPIAPKTPGAAAAGSSSSAASNSVCTAVVDDRISLISSSGVRSLRATTPCSVNCPIIPSTWSGFPISTSSCGVPARSASRCAVCAATSCTVHPGRSVAAVHCSAVSRSSTDVNESIACHQVSTYVVNGGVSGRSLMFRA